MELIGSLDVGNFFEHIHKLRQIEKLCKPCTRPIAGAFRGKFQRRDRFAKS